MAVLWNWLNKNTRSEILCLWFRASLIYINNCPTRCNTNQSVYYSASSLYMFRMWTTPIIRSTQNCNCSLGYWSYFLCSHLPPTWPSLATSEGGSCFVLHLVGQLLIYILWNFFNSRSWLYRLLCKILWLHKKNKKQFQYTTTPLLSGGCRVTL